MKERTPYREDTEPRGLTRRSFLAEAAGTAGLLAIPFWLRSDNAEMGPSKTEPVEVTIEEVERGILSALQHSEESETARERKLVPEWELTGSDCLITLGYSADEAEMELENDWDKILKSFLPGTHMHVVSTAGAKNVLETKLRSAHPHLKFSIYELPIDSFGERSFSQDVLFSGGLKDERGRFIIYTSTLDRLLMPEAMQDGFLFMGEYGDELLAANFPDRFVSRPMPLKCEGGDLQPTRLPNGQSALILGDGNFRINVAAVIHSANANGRRYKNGNFDYSYKLTKGAYQRLFDVDRAIVLDEDNLLADLPGQTLDKFADGRSEFYHADMCVRTAVDPKGKYVAFVTSTDTDKTSVGPKDIKHLEGVRKQFEELGFDIVRLPCGREPALNYTNVLIFTPKNGQPTVMLPCYGNELDDVAAKLYADRGFKVIKSDMSDLMRSKDHIMGNGSLHCLVRTLS